MTDRALVALDDVRDIPFSANGHQQDAPEHSWQPANLLELAANPPAPPTIGGLLYPGKRTVLSGETESMKTWLALILCKAEIEIGHPVGWVDLDAMGPGALLERLQLLGLQDEQIADDFLYYEPSEMLDTPKIGAVAQTIVDRSIRLFVIDAFNPILALHGLEPNAVTDIEKFWTSIADPICRAGAAPVLLDHVVKNADNRGKYSTGSERKASGAIVHLGFRLLQALTKGGTGKSLLTVHKDRPGYLPRPAIGRLVITSANSEIAYRIEPDKSHDGDTFRPTVLMEKLSRWLEGQTEPVSRNTIEEAVTGNREALRAALELLVDDGHADRQDGPRRAKLFTASKPYREADDTPSVDFAPTSPDFALDLTSSRASTSPSPPPYRGRRAKSDAEDQGHSGRSQGEVGEVIHEYDNPPVSIEELQAVQPDDGWEWKQ